MPQLVVLRVVSLPATVSSSMKNSNSASDSLSPSISELMSLVTMSSRGSVLALLGELVDVPVELGHRRHVVVGAAVLRVVDADHPVRPVEEQLAVFLRHAHDLGDRLQRQLGGEVLDEVAAAPSR